MTRFNANMLMFLAAFLWGAGNVAQKTVLEDLGPMLSFGLRSLIGLAVVAPFFWREARGAAAITDAQWRDLAAVSIVFCVALALQQLAYGGTTVTNASFLINSTVVFTPILAWLMLGQMPTLVVLPAIGLALIGVMLMSGGLTMPSWGDACCIASAILYSVWIVLVARIAGEMDRPFTLAACQFGVAAIVGIVFGLSVEAVSLPALGRAAPELAMLGVMSTGIAFTLQAVAQRYTPASDAAIVMSAESVFGAAAATLILGEQLNFAGSVGAGLILAAILLIQVPAALSAGWLSRAWPSGAAPRAAAAAAAPGRPPPR